jgi:hypothetical protein
MRQPAIDADVVPGLAVNSLLSTSKLADAGYITVFTNNEVKIFDAAAAPFQLQGSVVMQGWRCTKTKLRRVPFQRPARRAPKSQRLCNVRNGEIREIFVAS